MENKRASSSKSNIIQSSTKCSFRRAFWSSEKLLSKLEKKKIICNEQLKLEIHDEMWRNLIAEYDATHLSTRLRQNNLCFSQEFNFFEKIWLLDELNHYQGLLRIYCAIFDLDHAIIHKKVAARLPDFSYVKDILDDEFILCVCFAYDELASTRGYAEAFPLYDSFKVPEVSKWIRLAARDEWYHSLNAQSIIKTIFPEKIQNVPQTLKEIVERDQNRDEGYKGTFLFDHDHDEGNNPFNTSFLKKCANDICRFLFVPPVFQGSF